MTQTPMWLNDASNADFESAPVDDSAAQAKLSTALKLILLTLFLPEAFSFFVFSLRLTVTRLLFLVFVPFVAVRFVAKISQGNYRFVASDIFVPLSGFWMFLGPAVTHGVANTVFHSGPIVLEYLMAYLTTRALLSGRGEAIAFVELLCVVIAFVVADALLDTVTGRYVTREVAGQITGYQKTWNVADGYRFGFLRAAGPIEHPILLGFVCALGFLISVSAISRFGRVCAVMSGLGVVIAFSSAPQQCLAIGIALLFYSRLFKEVPHKWLLLSLPPMLGAVVLIESTNSPFGHLFDYLTIDPQTAYFRLYVWNVIGPAVVQSPYFGAVDGSYDYGGSVDSLWLVLAMDYGIPCAILTGLSMIGSCSLPTSGPSVCLSDAEAKLGTILGIIIFLIIFMGFTVDLWGTTWILVGLLVGVRAHLGELGHVNTEVASDVVGNEFSD